MLANESLTLEVPVPAPVLEVERFAAEKGKHSVGKGPVPRNDHIRRMRKVELRNEGKAVSAKGFNGGQERCVGAYEIGRASDFVTRPRGGQTIIVVGLVVGRFGQQKRVRREK